MMCVLMTREAIIFLTVKSLRKIKCLLLSMKVSTVHINAEYPVYPLKSQNKLTQSCQKQNRLS